MAYEDFTAYTEVDEGDNITIIANSIYWDTPTRNLTGYIYKDKGIDHFDGDFTHKFRIYFAGLWNAALACHWMLSNTIGDQYALSTGSADGYTFYSYDNTERLYLRIWEDGIFTEDIWPAHGPQPGTWYYIEIVRDDDGGANNTGRLTSYIRTGSHTGALQDTLVVDSSAGEQNDFRYIYGMATYNDGIASPGWHQGYTQNLDLGEVPAGWTGKMCGITNPAKIMKMLVLLIFKVSGIAGT